MDEQILNKYRLSDRIFFALQLAVEQKDINVADTLVHALEQSMTLQLGRWRICRTPRLST